MCAKQEGASRNRAGVDLVGLRGMRRRHSATRQPLVGLSSIAGRIRATALPLQLRAHAHPLAASRRRPRTPRPTPSYAADSRSRARGPAPLASHPRLPIPAAQVAVTFHCRPAHQQQPFFQSIEDTRDVKRPSPCATRDLPAYERVVGSRSSRAVSASCDRKAAARRKQACPVGVQ